MDAGFSIFIKTRRVRHFVGSDLRIRQLMISIKQRAQLASQLYEVFDLEIAFYDPGINHFGIEPAEYL